MHDTRLNRTAIALAFVLLVGVGRLQAETGKPAQVKPAITPPPSWVIVDVPAEFRAFVGKEGLPEPYPSSKRPIGVGTQSIDFWQANHFLVYRPETARFLYTDYTPTTVQYVKGTLPTFERFVEQHLYAMTCDRDKAILLLREVLPKLLVHPAMAPIGPDVSSGRGLLDEELLESERGYCNEQARVFVRLCQVANIPARLVFLFYSDKKNGHVVAEFYAENRWSMADGSWFTVFPAADGHLMSAAESHEEGRKAAGEAYHRRYQQLVQMGDQELAGVRFADFRDPARRNRLTAQAAESVRNQLRSQSSESIGNTLWAFGILNYPLPPKADK